MSSGVTTEGEIHKAEQICTAELNMKAWIQLLKISFFPPYLTLFIDELREGFAVLIYSHGSS